MFSRKLIVVIAMLISEFVLANAQDPEVVKELDLQKYVGSWYEIAHFPTFFQKFCERSEAKYSLNEKGTVGVLNTCFRDDKVLTTIQGTASAPNANEPAKLVVDFGFPAKGDYWIIALDEQYQWAVVSGPKKESLFILSRVVPMDAGLLDSILKALEAKGFDLSRIVFDKY
jgi:apolipoprotein D and lipocalin family protein